MPEDQPDTDRGEEELQVTDLRPPRARASGQACLPSLFTRAWRRLILGLSLALLVAVLLGNVLFRAGVWHGPSRALALPTATETAGPASGIVFSLPRTLASPELAPTVVPNSSVEHAVNPAPARCSQESPVLTVDGNPNLGMAIGEAPVLLGGFRGPYATLPVGPAASAQLNDLGWTAPYTQYGWPAVIELIVHSGVAGPVTLSGWDVRTGYPLWFGFVVAGVWGAPHQVTRTFSLDPTNPAIPAGGGLGTEQFWYGYAFLPGAGCYMLTASWPGGSWRITVSGGAVSIGG